MASQIEKPTSIALVASEDDMVMSFRRLLANPSILIHCYDSIHQLKREHNQFLNSSGIVVDLQTEISASTEEKDYIRTLKKYQKQPFLEIAIPSSNTPMEQLQSLRGRIDAFIKSAIEFTSQNNLRIAPRVPRILKVKVGASPTMNPSESPIIRAVTSDLSEGGCFVVSFGSFAKERDLYLEFNDSGIVVPCRMAWDRKWEQVNNRFPGFGAQFKDLEPKAKQEINRLLEESVQ